MKKIVLILALSTTFVFNSCGVMFGGSRYLADIEVLDHPNAEIYANGEKIGVGKATKDFKRSKDLNVEVLKDGCEPKKQTFERKFRVGNFILSALGFGIIGAGIDLGTGAAYKPDHINDKSIERLSDKKYLFKVDYSECSK